MMLLGVLFSFGYGSYLMAVKINLSQSTVFSSFYILISLFLGASYLGEWQLLNPLTLTGQKTILGVVLIFISIWLFVVVEKKKEEKSNIRWLIFSLINIIVAGIGTFWGKSFIQNHGPIETLISESLGGLPVLFIINAARKQNFRIAKTDQIVAILDGFIVVLAVTFFYVALKNGPLSLILPIQTIALTIAIVLVGIFFFKETQSLTGRKIAGMILGIAGVILLMV